MNGPAPLVLDGEESVDNLANVHPDRLHEILGTLSQRVPRLEKVTAEPMADGRLLLRVKDAPFTDPFLARFASSVRRHVEDARVPRPAVRP